MTPRIIAFAGSLRRGSFNRRLVAVAARGAREAGAEVTAIDLAEFPMPLYDGDLEEADGLPESARTLKALFREHQGLLVASPEYNGAPSGVLKNTIDWISRKESPDEPPLAAFDGKVAGLMAASPGALGGLRGLAHLNTILSGIKVLVLPLKIAVGGAHEAFADDGSLKDGKRQQSVLALGASVAETVRKLHG